MVSAIPRRSVFSNWRKKSPPRHHASDFRRKRHRQRLFARLIHELGPRRDAPFLKIDCASLPRNSSKANSLVTKRRLHRRRRSQAGPLRTRRRRHHRSRRNRRASNPPPKASCCAFLQERTFERLGGTETIRIDARLIALTNVDLPAAVKAGNFREDLYFRLNVLALAVPPLRERREDILPLADHLLAVPAHHSRSSQSPTQRRRPPHAHRLCLARQHPRTPQRPRARRSFLRSTERRFRRQRSTRISRAAKFPRIRSRLRPRTSPPSSAPSKTWNAKSSPTLSKPLHYKISQAAASLGISRKTLLEKRKKYGLK